MSKKELRRGEVILKVVNGDLTREKAGYELSISLRHVKRMCKRFKEEGLEGLAHRSRGKSSTRKTSSNTQARVLELIKNDYPDFGPQLIKEQLEERNQIKVSREWIRLLVIGEGLWKVKKRKNARFYQKRNRRSQKGELVQIDGSPEYWFENRSQKCCLINMVDDATSEIMDAQFVEEECLKGYFLGMKNYIKTHGRPLALYSDRHTIFKSPKTEGKRNLTQFGRAMKELDIELIHANSPQAKGRVERSHSTLQDRLIKLMRLDGISSIEEGNKYLKEFIKDYNRRFGKKPRDSESAHRGLSNDIELDKILCKKERRKVSKSLEVQYIHKTYQLVPEDNGCRLRGRTVQIFELNNEIKIQFDGKDYYLDLLFYNLKLRRFIVCEINLYFQLMKILRLACV